MFLNIFNILAATQKVVCYGFLHVLTESEQNYFHQNLGERWSATMENKQLFFDPTLIQTTCFPYNTAEVQDINLKLSESKLQYILSWKFELTSFNAGWLIYYDMYFITTLSVRPSAGMFLNPGP